MFPIVLRFCGTVHLSNMSFLVRILIALGFMSLNVFALWEEIAGPYDITFKNMAECEKKGAVRLFQSMRFGKINRTHFNYSGIVDSGEDFTDNVRIRMVASNKGTNGRYNNVIDVQYKVCELISMFAMPIVGSIFRHCNQTYECPRKRFTCEMKNWIFVYDVTNVPALPYGEYRLDIYAYKVAPNIMKQLISCTRFYGVVTPKLPKSSKNTQ